MSIVRSAVAGLGAMLLACADPRAEQVLGPSGGVGHLEAGADDATLSTYDRPVLRTSPSADAEGRILGRVPLDVTFNLCRAEAEEGEQLKYRYDFGVFRRIRG